MLRSNPCRVGSKPSPPRCHLPIEADGVAGGLERFGDRFFFQGQFLPDQRPRELPSRQVAATRKPIGQMKPRWVFAGHECSPGGRTDRAGRIRLR